MIKIPNYKDINLKHIVCDYNGTIAKDGIVLPHVKELFEKLSHFYTVHVITADTFFTVEKQLKDYNVQVKVITSNDHTQEKADFINTLDASTCGAIGNGNNDTKMLKSANIGIAIIGDEGCNSNTIMNSDIVCKNIVDALELFLNSKRLIATLRK